MPETPAAPEEAPRRGCERLQLGIVAQLQTLDGPQRVRILDISQTGAHLVLSRDVALKQAFLSWLSFEAFGDVMWQRGLEVGIKFDRPLPLGHLAETRRCAPSVVREEQQDIQSAAQAWVAGDADRRTFR